MQPPRRIGSRSGWGAAVGIAIATMAAASPPDPAAELRGAAAAYAKAFNDRDYAALGDQWTERARLVEGSQAVSGREAIVASLRAWREQQPAATMTIEVSSIDLLAEPLARVDGTIAFTQAPGKKPVVSRFTSLRVREGDTWRLAESLVIPEHAAALDALDWLVGTWSAEAAGGPEGGKASIETVYEKQLGGHCLVGHSKIRPAAGPPLEALEVIHADRDTGLIRSWVFDSTGAQAQGIVDSDGTSLHKLMQGTPSDRVPGRVARWTEVVSPTGAGRCTMHAIDRSIDGVAMPDGPPLHCRKIH